MFSTLKPRFFSTSLNLGREIQRVAVIGAGSMGSGIAQVIAQSGKNVNLVDQEVSVLDKAKNGIEKSLSKIGKKKFPDNTGAISKFVSDTLGNISCVKDPIEASSTADLVIEAIIEHRDTKKKLFSELDKAAPPSTIFTSNTSSLLIQSISDATTRKDRFAGLHFFNPVPIMKLLEIVNTPDTSEETYKTLHEFGKSIGKVCVKCKDKPGFIVNRLLIPHMMDAVLMVERGDATTEDVDIAMKLGAGYPMGPFELIDFVGLDLMKFVTDGWARDYPNDPSFRTSKLLAEKVAQKRYGRKVGKGWYDYPD